MAYTPNRAFARFTPICNFVPIIASSLVLATDAGSIEGISRCSFLKPHSLQVERLCTVVNRALSAVMTGGTSSEH